MSRTKVTTVLVGVESIPYVVKCQISSINRTPAALHKAEYTRIRDLFFKADRLFHVPHALLHITNPAAQPFRYCSSASALRRLLFIYTKLDLRWANESTAITSSCFETAIRTINTFCYTPHSTLVCAPVSLLSIGAVSGPSGPSVPRAKAEMKIPPWL
jgi:hypothetical protein